MHLIRSLLSAAFALSVAGCATQPAGPVDHGPPVHRHGGGYGHYHDGYYHTHRYPPPGWYDPYGSPYYGGYYNGYPGGYPGGYPYRRPPARPAPPPAQPPPAQPPPTYAPKPPPQVPVDRSPPPDPGPSVRQEPPRSGLGRAARRVIERDRQKP